jgi:hypothetical protein
MIPPGVETLHDPSARNEIRIAFRFGNFLAARTDVRDIAARRHFLGLPDLSGVKAEVSSRHLVVRTSCSRVR